MKPEPRKSHWNQNRKTVLLGVLVALTFIVMMLEWKDDSESTRAAVSKRAAINRSTNQLEDPNLLADRLGVQPPEFTDEKRNLFDFYQPPAPEPPVNAEREPDIPQSVCGNQVCEGGEDYQNCPSDCQPPPPPIPPISLRYIGYMSQKSGAVVFLTDGKEVYIGRVNDIIANKYRVLKISAENVELGYLNLNESRTIPFQGSQGG